MSDALVRSDEKHPSLTSEIIFALRQLWHFRTLCILRNERIENKVVERCAALNLNLLELQERLLFLEPVDNGREAVTLKGLQNVCLEADWGRQTTGLAIQLNCQIVYDERCHPAHAPENHLFDSIHEYLI